MNVSPNAPKLLTYTPAAPAKTEKADASQDNQGIVYDSTSWTGDTEGHYMTKGAKALKNFAAKNSGKSEKCSSTLSRMKTGALAGAALGVIAPALTIIGIAAIPITLPMGAIMGAFAGAVSGE